MTEENANPGDGDQETDDKSDKMIPESRLKAALKDQGEKHAAEIETLKTGFEQRITKLENPPAPAKEEETFTRAELKKLVEDEHITQEQADLKWDAQLEAKFEKKAQKVSEGVVNEKQLSQKVENEIDRYVALKPDISKEGTETRNKIKREFKFLVKMGDSATSMATELKAIRAVLGPIEALELAGSGKTSHDSHEETGGEGGGGEGGGKKFEDSLSDRKRKYYQGMIDKGLYKDWKEVKELLHPSKKAA